MINLKVKISEEVTTKLLEMGIEAELEVEIIPLFIEKKIIIVDDEILKSRAEIECPVENASHFEVKMKLFIDGCCEAINGDYFAINDANIVKKASRLIIDTFLQDWGE